MDNYYTCTSSCVILAKQLIAELHSRVVSTDIVRTRCCFVSPLIPHYHEIFQIIGVFEDSSCSNIISNMINTLRVYPERSSKLRFLMLPKHHHVAK